MVWRRRMKRLLFWSLTLSVIVLAVVVGLIQLALPWWASDAGRVARLLSSRLGSPVSIEATHPHWTSRGPLIELEGVRFGAADDAESAWVEHAAWAIDFSGLVRPSRSFSEFRLHGVTVTLAREANGQWTVFGFPELLKGKTERSLSNVLRALPSFALRDSRLTLHPAPDKPPVTFALPELRQVPGAGGDRWRGRIAPVTETENPGELLVGLDLTGTDQGRLHVAGQALSLPAWLGLMEPAGLNPVAGRLNLRLWADFDDSGVHDAQVEVEQTDSRWLEPSFPTAAHGGDAAHSPVTDVDADAGIRLPSLRFGARWQRSNAAIRLLIDDLVFADGAPARLVGEGGGGRFRLHGEDLALTPFAIAATLTDATPLALRRWLRGAQPGGHIRVLDAYGDQDGFRQVAMTLDGLHATASDGAPGIQGLSARMRADRDGAVLYPDGSDIGLNYPGVFAERIDFNVTGGAIAAWRENDAWHFAADRLGLGGDGFQARVAGGVSLPPGEPPRFDIGAVVADTDVEAVKQFWPLNKIPNTARWLNRSLDGGRIADARAWIRGPANGFPFKDHDGRLDVVAQVTGVGLAYHEDWPTLSDAEAEVVFENATLRIKGENVRIAGIEVKGATADVPDLKRPILRVRGRARAKGVQIFDFVSQSPLQERYGDHLQGMSIDGAPLIDIDLRIPMKRELGETAVDGRIAFAGERFIDDVHRLQFDDLNGVLQLTRHGLGTEALALSLAGEPARLDLRIGAAARDAATAVEAELTGRLSAAALFGRVDGMAPIVAATKGRADWRVRLHVPDAGGGDAAGWIRVDSDLNGLALSLPAPLAKSADSVLPLQLRAGTRTHGRPIDVQLGQVLRLRAKLGSPDRAFAGVVALGGAEPEALPDRGLIVSGQAPALDLTGWLALDARDETPAANDASVEWPRVVLRVGELGVWGRAFRDVDLQMLPDQDSVDVRLRGPDIEGTISWPRAAVGRVVRGRFERLYVPPGGSGTELGGSFPPSAMPALDVEAQDLRVGVSRLGHTKLVAHPQHDSAYRIETFESRSDAFDLEASGDWRRIDGEDRSDFDIRLRADDLGVMLESFGFAGLISGGRTDATIDGQWAGSPAGFALEKIDGRLSVNIQSGRIIDVDPGVGRIFGLLNLREIPRRLILDFRDFFSQGMRFNSIEGTFALNVGEAYTDDMRLKSPSADILITGRTGLIMRDYDQTLEVTPRMGGTLPVVGAIAGGPAGAAAGLVVQGLLRIDDAAKIIYRVTGPWDDPVIIKQEPATSAARRERHYSDSMEPST